MVVGTFTDVNTYSARLAVHDGRRLGLDQLGRRQHAVHQFHQPGGGARRGNGNFAIVGSNTYEAADGYSILVTVTDSGGESTTLTAAATVTPAPMTAGPTVNITNAVEGVAFSGPVAYFSSENPFADTSGFFATIFWGDTTSSPGQITAPRPRRSRVWACRPRARGSA